MHTMWVVCELRRGDILMTHALCPTKMLAFGRLMDKMETNPYQDVWWKILEVPPNAVHTPMIAGTLYKVAVWCDWEEDNATRVVGIFDENEPIPDNLREDELIWVDQVRFE